MKPVAIFRCAPTEGPGYFATLLERRAIACKLIALDEGAPVPRDARAFCGMAIMGGPMSANDGVPWIAPLLELIRDGVRKDVPALGHCLGGQLMSKAFGGIVSANPVKEIGWGETTTAENEVARAWFGELRSFQPFHWHGETFTIPPGATRIASSAHCANQAFALGKHLGMQMHIEMTADLVRLWCHSGAGEIAAAGASPGVQSPERIEAELDARIAALHKVADRVYDKWFEGLARP